MKKLLPFLGALLLTSCVSLPSLTPDNEVLASEVAIYTCMAEKAGALKGNAEPTPAQLEAMIRDVQAQGMPHLTIPPDQLQARIDALGKDPVQLGLFLQAIAGEREKCQNGNKNAS